MKRALPEQKLIIYVTATNEINHSQLIKTDYECDYDDDDFHNLCSLVSVLHSFEDWPGGLEGLRYEWGPRRCVL